MRLLLSCDQCRRQYDATGRKPGSRFRCHCGSVLTVASPAGHDSRVVRCSSCGAPRELHAKSCGFCHADFTLRDQDLHTVCPECLSRVSDRARFCHHCGVAITPELTSGEESPLPCPMCGTDRHLVSRRMGTESVTVLECDCCAGMWLGKDAFERLTERASKMSLDEDTTKKPPPRAGAPESGRWQYRPCPVCRGLMQRRNYGRQSGVIIDVCRNHGFWFDAEELPRILAWIRRGGLQAAQRSKDEQEKAAEQTQRIAKAGRKVTSEHAADGQFLFGDEPGPADPWNIIAEVVNRLFKLR